MYIERTNSTNTLLRELVARGEWPQRERVLRAGYQTAGRGQTGNGWESEEGKNLLCSMLLPPREDMFDLTVAVSAAVHSVLVSVLGPCDGLCSGLSIKWPNDIYWQDRKIAGILIEGAIVGGKLQYAIVGIGLNVNQTAFVSGAPNPVSLAQISGREYDLDELTELLVAAVQRALRGEDVWAYYKAHLYRREGFWPFVEREVSTAPTMNAEADTENQFMARIEDVLPTGEIVLRDKEGKRRQYHFKQIRYVL